jgi:hypothetical protein
VDFFIGRGCVLDRRGWLAISTHLKKDGWLRFLVVIAGPLLERVRREWVYIYKSIKQLKYRPFFWNVILYSWIGVTLIEVCWNDFIQCCFLHGPRPSEVNVLVGSEYSSQLIQRWK